MTFALETVYRIGSSYRFKFSSSSAILEMPCMIGVFVMISDIEQVKVGDVTVS